MKLKKKGRLKLFDCKNCKGLCCGAIPITKSELNKIKKEIKKMPFYQKDRLMKQKRKPLTCIFYDTEKNECAIYTARPLICKMFGFYEGMVCPKKPELATKSREEGYRRLNKNAKNDEIVGVLSATISWKDLI